jgi:hypothetical protein
MQNGQRRLTNGFAGDVPVIDMQAESSQKILNDVPDAIKDYAVDLFWIHYNSALHVVHRDAFLSDKNGGETHFYTRFLYICIIVMGCKFSSRSDPRDPEIQTTGTVLRNVANLIANYLSQSTPVVATVQALLILSDLEFGFGRETVGQKYLSTYSLPHDRFLRPQFR